MRVRLVEELLVGINMLFGDTSMIPMARHAVAPQHSAAGLSTTAAPVAQAGRIRNRGLGALVRQPPPGTFTGQEWPGTSGSVQPEKLGNLSICHAGAGIHR